jgi:hypothetical protein
VRHECNFSAFAFFHAIHLMLGLRTSGSRWRDS